MSREATLEALLRRAMPKLNPADARSRELIGDIAAALAREFECLEPDCTVSVPLAGAWCPAHVPEPATVKDGLTVAAPRDADFACGYPYDDGSFCNLPRGHLTVVPGAHDPPAAPRVEPRRCMVTGNPCGTDTRAKGDPCRCFTCACERVGDPPTTALATSASPVAPAVAAPARACPCCTDETIPAAVDCTRPPWRNEQQETRPPHRMPPLPLAAVAPAVERVDLPSVVAVNDSAGTSIRCTLSGVTVKNDAWGDLNVNDDGKLGAALDALDEACATHSHFWYLGERGPHGFPPPAVAAPAVPLPDTGRCEALDVVNGESVRCGSGGGRVRETMPLGGTRTRIICRDHGFEADLHQPEPPLPPDALHGKRSSHGTPAECVAAGNISDTHGEHGHGCGICGGDVPCADVPSCGDALHAEGEALGRAGEHAEVRIVSEDRDSWRNHAKNLMLARSAAWTQRDRLAADLTDARAQLEEAVAKAGVTYTNALNRWSTERDALAVRLDDAAKALETIRDDFDCRSTAHHQEHEMHCYVCIARAALAAARAGEGG